MNAIISAFVICVDAIIHLLLYNLHDCTFRYTNADMKILQYTPFHTKNSIIQIVHYKIFPFLRYVHFRYAKCLFKNIQKDEIRLKVAYFLRTIQTLQANNSRILRIQNATFLGYYSFMNTNIWRDFEICICVPLKKLWKHSFRYSVPVRKLHTCCSERGL